MSCIHLLRGEKLSQSPLQDAQGPKHRAGCGCPGAVPALLAESCAPSHAGSTRESCSFGATSHVLHWEDRDTRWLPRLCNEIDIQVFLETSQIPAAGSRFRQVMSPGVTVAAPVPG